MASDVGVTVVNNRFELSACLALNTSPGSQLRGQLHARKEIRLNRSYNPSPGLAGTPAACHGREQLQHLPLRHTVHLNMNETDKNRSYHALADVSNTLQPLHTVTAACLNTKQLQHQQPQPKQLVVTSSGFKGAAKNQIKQLAADLGALYSGELVQGLTTHLVGALQQTATGLHLLH